MTTFYSFSKHPAWRFETWRQRRSVTSAHSPAWQAAEHAIGSLPDWRKQFVLTSRYVDTPALTWPQIAEALGLSLRQTYRMKNNAINDICKMTDGRVLAAVS